MPTPLIKAAHKLAVWHHAGVYRKWLTPPQEYIVHPTRVAHRAAMLVGLNPFDLEVAVATGFTHDTLEDPTIQGFYLTKDSLREATSYEVANWTDYLTNPSKKRPDLNRAARKQLDREHIATIPAVPKLLKLIDRTDNLLEMTGAPVDFIRVYIAETELLFEAIGVVPGADYFVLAKEFEAALEKARSLIKVV